MAISPAGAAATGARNAARNLMNANLSMGLPPNAGPTQTAQKAVENTQALTETKETLTTTQNSLNEANTNLNNANKQISNLQGQVEELKKNGGSFVKIDTYIPHKDSYKSVTDITVSGAGAFGSEEDGDYTDYSSANGKYLVTPETAENENPFERVYKHETANWYIHGYFEEEYEEGYWYIGTSPDSERLARSTSSNEQIQSGTYTFEDWDWGWEVEVTLAVNEVDVPEQPLVLTGRKSTGFDPDTWEFTWSDESESFLECSETPEPGMIFAASGNQLLFGYLYSDDKSKCVFYHRFDSHKDTADSGQPFEYSNEPYVYAVVDRVKCALQVRTGTEEQLYVPLGDVVDGNLFVARSYVMRVFCSRSGYKYDCEAPVIFATGRNKGERHTGFDTYDSRPLTKYNDHTALELGTVREENLDGQWHQYVFNIRDGKTEIWLDDKLIERGELPNREDGGNAYVTLMLPWGGTNGMYSASYMADCRVYSSRALTGQEIKLMWEKFQKERDEFVPVNIPSVDDNTVLAISLNEGLLKDYSTYAHEIERPNLDPNYTAANGYGDSGVIINGRDGESAWRFDSGYLKVAPKDSELTLRGNWTIEFDVCLPDGLPGDSNRNFIGFSNGQGLAIAYGRTWLDDVECGFCISESGDNWKVLSPQIETKTWTHVKITRSGTTVSCSLDGLSTGLTANITSEAFASPDLPLRIGTARGLYSFFGRINNFVISNVAR